MLYSDKAQTKQVPLNFCGTISEKLSTVRIFKNFPNEFLKLNLEIIPGLYA